MKKAGMLAVSAILLLAMCSSLTAANKNTAVSRSLSGSVTDRGGTPVANAIVYLKDTKSLAVKSYITGNDGAFRFPALSPNVDYEVYAQIDGHRSDTKTLSSFDSRPQAVINLKIDTSR
jgi:hypothetical protein